MWVGGPLLDVKRKSEVPERTDGFSLGAEGRQSERDRGVDSRLQVSRDKNSCKVIFKSLNLGGSWMLSRTYKSTYLLDKNRIDLKFRILRLTDTDQR